MKGIILGRVLMIIVLLGGISFLYYYKQNAPNIAAQYIKTEYPEIKYKCEEAISRPKVHLIYFKNLGEDSFDFKVVVEEGKVIYDDYLENKFAYQAQKEITPFIKKHISDYEKLYVFNTLKVKDIKNYSEYNLELKKAFCYKENFSKKHDNIETTMTLTYREDNISKQEFAKQTSKIIKEVVDGGYNMNFIVNCESSNNEMFSAHVNIQQDGFETKDILQLTNKIQIVE